MESFWPWIVLIILIISTLGTILPAIPGLPVAAAAIIIYGWMEGFNKVDSVLVIVTVLLTAAGTLAEYIAGPYTVKKYGGSKSSIWGAVMGGIIGLFVMGPVGLILGPLAGAVGGELMAGRKLQQAVRVGLASLAGIIAGNIIKFFFGVTITVLFFMKVI